MEDILNNPGGRTLTRGYAGNWADTSAHIAVTRKNENAAVIDYGIAVARGAANDTCKVITADADKVAGISVRHVTAPYNPTTGEVAYRQYDTVPLARFGRLLVTALENATEGDQVLFITAQGGKLGSTTGGAAGAGRVAVPGARWAETVAAGAVGIIEINMLGAN